MSRSGHITGVPEGEWHQFRRDPQLSGRSPLKGRITRPALRWRHSVGFPLSAGTQASSLLCHGFAEGGMHLIDVHVMAAGGVV